MGEKWGFDTVARLRYYWQKPRRGRVRGDRAGRRDVGAVHDFIRASHALRLASGLISEGWVFKEYSRKRLAAHIRARSVGVLRGSGGIRGVAIYPNEENEESLTLGFVDGDDVAIKVLARDCMYRARSIGLAHCSASVPTRGYAGLLEAAGYRRKDSVGQVVLELGGARVRSLSAGKAR
jgi:hypothetical protein